MNIFFNVCMYVFNILIIMALFNGSVTSCLSVGWLPVGWSVGNSVRVKILEGRFQVTLPCFIEALVFFKQSPPLRQRKGLSNHRNERQIYIDGLQELSCSRMDEYIYDIIRKIVLYEGLGIAYLLQRKILMTYISIHIYFFRGAQH